MKQCDFSNTKAGAYLKDAYLLINKPSLLSAAINDIDDLPLEQDDIKGNLYEYLLSKLSTAGINGQFRTPRHIIKMIVELVDPKKMSVSLTQCAVPPVFGSGIKSYFAEKQFRFRANNR